MGQRDYTFVPGAIDSQLTHDGAHVLAWSSTLAPTGPGAPLQLSVTERDGATQWTVDTDGSVLVASRAVQRHVGSMTATRRRGPASASTGSR